jgi:uncharacterized protein YebE (UPF0316 family)
MKLLILCTEIFFARILDVALGTIKTFYIVKEKKLIASLISFIEIIIWFIVAKEALNTEIKSYFIPISYGLGYATGTYIGTLISSKYISGHLTVHIISSKIKKKDIEYLKQEGFGLTSITLENKKMYLIIEIDKKRLNHLNDCLKKIDENAFIIANESKIVQNGFFNQI